MFCGECGFKNEPGAKFCAECGKPLNTDEKTEEKKAPKKVTPKERKPMSKKAKIGLTAGIIIVILLVIGFVIGKNLTDPKKIASDYFDKEAGKNRMASIDQTRYFPGTFSDSDAKSILFPESSAVAISDGVVISDGRFGKYLKTADGRNVMIPRPFKNSITPELASLIVSLPKTIGQDGNGSDIVLCAGPYGFYARCNDKNISVSDPFNPDVDSIRKEAEGGGKGKDSLCDFGEWEGKSLRILSGRYGAYIKWGEKNFAIPKAEQKNAAALSEERVHEIVAAEPGKSNAVKEFGEYQGKALQILSGKYGYYIKWGDKNCAIPKDERENALSMTEERAREIASCAPEKSARAGKRTFRSKK